MSQPNVHRVHTLGADWRAMLDEAKLRRAGCPSALDLLLPEAKARLDRAMETSRITVGPSTTVRRGRPRSPHKCTKCGSRVSSDLTVICYTCAKRGDRLCPDCKAMGAKTPLGHKRRFCDTHSLARQKASKQRKNRDYRARMASPKKQQGPRHNRRKAA